MLNLYSILSLLACAIYTSLIVLVVNRRIRFQLKLSFVITCSSLAVWSLAYAFVYPASSLQDMTNLWVWFHIAAIGWCLLPSAVMHFVLALTNFRHLLRDYRTHFAIYLPALAAFFINVNGPSSVIGFQAVGNVVVEVSHLDPGTMTLHAMYYFIFYLAATLVLLHWARHTRSDNERMQGFVIAAAIAISMIVGIGVNLMAPVLHLNIPGGAHIIALLYAFAIWWSMRYHGFFSHSYVIAAQRVLEYIDEMVFVIGVDREIAYTNRQVSQLLGYSPEDIKGKKLESLGASPFLIGDFLKRTEDGDHNDSLLTVMTTSCGESIDVKISASIIQDEGESLGLVAVVQDMRLTMRLEHEIREKTRAEQAYRELFDNANDLIYVYDFDGRLISANRTALQVTGFTFDEITNYNVYEIVIPEDHDKIRSLMQNRLGGAHLMWYEVGIRTKGGRQIDLEVSSRLVFRNDQAVAIEGTARDITERKQLEARMRYLSMRDAITGLYNRGFFNEEMKKLDESRQYPVGLIICDVDGLKLVNDRLGHIRGDQLLVDAAELIRGCFRQEDTVARLGGDEFGILLAATPAEKVAAAAERIIHSVEQHNAAGPEIDLGLSVGWAVAVDPGVSMDELFRQADDNMYVYKTSPRTVAFKKSLDNKLRPVGASTG